MSQRTDQVAQEEKDKQLVRNAHDCAIHSYRSLSCNFLLRLPPRHQRQALSSLVSFDIVLRDLVWKAEVWTRLLPTWVVKCCAQMIQHNEFTLPDIGTERCL